MMLRKDQGNALSLQAKIQNHTKIIILIQGSGRISPPAISQKIQSLIFILLSVCNIIISLVTVQYLPQLRAKMHKNHLGDGIWFIESGF